MSQEITIMRPLTQLDSLPQQQPVFNQQTDDFVQAFASNFDQQDALGSAAASGQTDVYAGLDPISQAIDAVGGMLNESANILDLLSGELDAVDLTPEIENFQSADQALDSGLTTTFDFTAAATSMINSMTSLITSILGPILKYLYDFINGLVFLINQIIVQVGQLFIAVFG